MIRIHDVADRPSVGPECARLLRIEDQEVGLEAYLAIDRVNDRPAFGGIRRRRFRSDEEARHEVLHLARGMGRKLAFAGLEIGGAKAVILDAPGLVSEALYDALGRAMVELGPIWVAGPDLGTDAADLEVLRRHTPEVNDPANDAGSSTARGVLRGIEAGLEALDGSRTIAGRRALIQGVGAVGSALARLLGAAGADLSVCELDARRLGALRAEFDREGRDFQVHPALDPADYGGDIAAPCAAGGFIDDHAAHHLKVRLVCGSANEQLSRVGLDLRLQERGVLVIPDFTVNAGAVIEGVVIHLEGESGRARAVALIDQTEDRVAALLATARSRGMTPWAAALAAIGEERS